MRLTLLLALVATALAASPRWESGKSSPSVYTEKASFRPGQTYRYHFDGQVATGLVVAQSQQALTRIQTHLEIVFSDERTALLQLQKIRVGSTQKEMNEPKNLQPFELCQEINLNEEQSRLLSLPLRFRYEKGMVSEIEFDREEQEWSTNIKRAVLNMLQVNIEKQGQTGETLPREMSESENENQQNFFTTQERTLEGDCETAYTFLPENSPRRNEETPVLRLTKSINFEKCTERAGIRYNFRFGDECPACENKYTGEERNIESSTVLNYEIVKSDKSFLIREVELRSQYVYTPINQKDSFFQTLVASRLTLVEVSKKSSTIPTPKSDNKESLLYTSEYEQRLERFHALGEEIRTPFSDIKNKPEIVSRLVKSCIVKMSDETKGVELIATHEFARLVKVLRMCTKDDIRKIHAQVCQNTEHEQKETELIKDIINDALAIAGTYNTVEHLIEKIRDRKVSPTKTVVLMSHLTNIRTPSEKILDQVLSFCKEARNPLERQSCWLTYGSLLRGLCGEHRDRLAMSSQKKQCPRPLKEKLVGEMTKAFESATTRYDKILVLKTMANSGVDLIVFPLENIINDLKEEKSIRLQAIDSLRLLRSVMPRKIQSILMPLYKNEKEQPEIRVSAFYQIIQTLPERSVLDQISSQLDKEPSHQVHSFVYTTLEQFSKSEIPCEKRMAEDIKVSLRLARVQPRKVLDSHFYHLPIFSEKHQMGGALNWAALFSNDSVLPKEMTASFESVAAGQWNKYLAQIGVSQQNIDQVLYKLIEKVNEKGLEEVLVRGKRSSSTFRPAEMLRGLFQKLAIKTRRSAQNEQDAQVLVYIRFRDQDYALLPIDEEVMPEIIKNVIRNGRIELGEIEQILSKGYRFRSTLSSFVYERTRKIVTSLGLPLKINSKMPTIADIRGQVHVEFEPKKGKTFEGIRLRLVAQPTLASTHITKMEVESPIVSHGIKLLHSAQFNTPIDMSVEINWQDKIVVKTTIRAPESRKRIAQLQTRPVTFVRVWPSETRVYVESQEKTVYVEQLESQVKALSRDYLEKETGLKVNVEGHVHGHIYQSGDEQMPSALLIGENNVEVTMEKGEEGLKEFVIRFEVENFGEEKEMEQPAFESFYDKKTSKHFNTDSSSLEENNQNDEEEMERRNSFNSYIKSYKSGKAYTHRVYVKAETVGARKERKAEMKLKSVCDEKMRHCKLHIEMERTPVGIESKNWKMNVIAKSLYPQMPYSLAELSQQKHREWTATLESQWGPEKENTILLKFQGQQNKEQKVWMQRLEENKENKLSTLEEYSQLVEAAQLNEYKLVADYKIESPVSQSGLDRFHSLLKSCWYTKMSPVNNQEGRLVAKLTLEPESRQYVNVTLETPRERLEMFDLRLPYPMRLVNIRRHYNPIRSFSGLAKKMITESGAECKVETSKIQTFDGVFYRTPITPCYTVLAKDCGSEEPDFAVLVKKVQKKGEEKKMKIITKENVLEFELLPEQESLKIKVNGEEEKNVERLESFGVYKHGRKIVSVELEQISVKFDGINVEIKMSQQYKNQQCGLCGHFDGEKQNEWRRADNEQTQNMEEFSRSYLAKDEECEMDESEMSEKKNYRLLSSSSSSEEESIFEPRQNKRVQKNEERRYDEQDRETVEPEEKTRVIEYSERICFSKQPVPECPRKSYEQDETVKSLKVKFGCVSRQSPEARRFVREARRGVIVSVEELPESFSQNLSVPKMCVVY